MSDSALKLGNEVLNFVRVNGPVLPVHVGERFGYNTIISSAVLSDLVSKGVVKFSTAKVGGSPVYFVQGQEHKLQGLYKYLGEKPRKVFDLLKENKVLRDKSLEPWQRVAVREIKDFSVMLRVNYNELEEIFWKWYLVPDDEVKSLVAEIIKSDLQSSAEVPAAPVLDDTPVHEPSLPVQEQVLEKASEPPNKEEPLEEVVEHKREVQKVFEGKKVKKTLKLKKQKSNLDFYGLVKSYFSSNQISVLEEFIVRKNLEFTFVVSIPSSVGPLQFFVIAKNKKAINEDELSLAYSQSQLKKLPVLFLSVGDMSKKASSYLNTNLKGYLSFRKIGS